MRRALDEARAELESLTDRDAILDCYFGQCRRLFHFAALFVVKGDTAYGRNVAGIGAPDELVTRLSFSLNEPGVLHRVRELRRPFVAAAARTDADNRLFGSLGRAMPGALVVPLVVRDRVVAIALGERAAELLEDRAFQAVRHPIELAKEEMLIWSQIVGEALERLILRKKGVGTSAAPGALESWLPPPGGGAGGGSWRPPAGGTASYRPPPRDDLPEPRSLRMAPPPSFESLTSQEPAVDLDSGALAEETPAPFARLRRYGWPLAAAGAVAALASVGLAVWLTRGDPDGGDRVVVRGDKLAGWPNAVDPMNALEPAHLASAGGAKAELASMKADLSRGGRVDFDAAQAATPGATPLRFVFVTKDNESELPVDARGIRMPRTQARRLCGDDPCLTPVPVPQCTTAQIWDAAKQGGLVDTDHALVTYAAQLDGPKPKPMWLVAVEGRGEMRVDATTCRPLPREKLLPAAVPLATITGGVHDIEPLQPVALARTQSGLESDAALLDIDVRGLGANGRVDLGLPENGVSYRFADPPSVPADRRRFRLVTLGIRGMPVATIETDRGGAAARYTSSVIRPPACSFAHAFKTIGSVPAGTVGHVTFGPDISSPGAGQWTIEVPAMGLHETISDDVCAAWEKLPAGAKPQKR